MTAADAIDPRNPVVALCAEGMQAEAERRPDDARRLFERAWAAHRDDYEGCIAAHYLARHQPTPADALAWNARALALAESVGDARVAAFLASLHLNVAHAHEMLGDADAARRHYALAERRLSALPDGAYAEVVRGGVRAGMARLDGMA